MFSILKQTNYSSTTFVMIKTIDGVQADVSLQDIQDLADFKYNCRSKYRNTNSGKNPLFSPLLENIKIAESSKFRYFSEISEQSREKSLFSSRKELFCESKSTLIVQVSNVLNKWPIFYSAFWTYKCNFPLEK